MKTSKRSLFAKYFVRSGLSTYTSDLRSHFVNDVRILTYHRILPRTELEKLGTDVELVSAWQDQFEWQMKYLKRRFNVMTARDLSRYLDQGIRLPKRAMIVSFDDGFTDNYEIAFPILRDLGLVATFFVCTGYIDTKRQFWFERVAQLIQTTSVRELTFSGGTERIAIPEQDSLRRKMVGQLLKRLQSIDDAERLMYCKQIEDQLAPNVDEKANAISLPMSWEQVRAMSDAGMEIGSHSVSHPILSKVVSAGLLKSELLESKAAIRAHIPHDVVSFAYPAGKWFSLNKEVVEAVKEAGYRMAFSYEPGLNRAVSMERHKCRRLSIERHLQNEHFECLVETPEVVGYAL